MKKKLALYNPYLDVLGGGEKHILSVLKVLENDYDLNIFWDEDITKEIKNKFSLTFNTKLNFIPNLFKSHSLINTFRTLWTLKSFDLFFYVTNGSYFFSSARNNYIFSMYPQKYLYNMTILNKLKLSNYKFISNSQFTGNLLTNWNIKNKTLYPYIDNSFFQSLETKKEKIILSVGRFYQHLHAKQHEITIRFFNKIKRNIKELQDYKLVLIGSSKPEDIPYFDKLKNLTKNDHSIELHNNISFKRLVEYYKKSNIYIHMTGFGKDDKKFPEQVEHLGITPLEAMASACITFCYNAGGPKEIIKDRENGFLFNNFDELNLKLASIFHFATSKNQIQIKSNAQQFVKENFSYEVFKKNVFKIITI